MSQPSMDDIPNVGLNVQTPPQEPNSLCVSCHFIAAAIFVNRATSGAEMAVEQLIHGGTIASCADRFTDLVECTRGDSSAQRHLVWCAFVPFVNAPRVRLFGNVETAAIRAGLFIRVKSARRSRTQAHGREKTASIAQQDIAVRRLQTALNLPPTFRNLRARPSSRYSGSAGA